MPLSVSLRGNPSEASSFKTTGSWFHGNKCENSIACGDLGSFQNNYRSPLFKTFGKNDSANTSSIVLDKVNNNAMNPNPNPPADYWNPTFGSSPMKMCLQIEAEKRQKALKTGGAKSSEVNGDDHKNNNEPSFASLFMDQLPKREKLKAEKKPSVRNISVELQNTAANELSEFEIFKKLISKNESNENAERENNNNESQLSVILQRDAKLTKPCLSELEIGSTLVVAHAKNGSRKNRHSFDDGEMVLLNKAGSSKNIISASKSKSMERFVSKGMCQDCVQEQIMRLLNVVRKKLKSSLLCTHVIYQNLNV